MGYDMNSSEAAADWSHQHQKCWKITRKRTYPKWLPPGFPRPVLDHHTIWRDKRTNEEIIVSHPYKIDHVDMMALAKFITKNPRIHVDIDGRTPYDEAGFTFTVTVMRHPLSRDMPS